MTELNICNKTISTPRRAFVMGILNATPDSFYSQSRGGIQKAFDLIEDGADILDIGGESTRPGFAEVPADEEIRRIIPVIKEIRKKSDILISVDTRKAEVFKAAFEEGADILNDVSALEDDPKMPEVLNHNDCGIILMHQFKGVESERKTSLDVIKAVEDYFYGRIEYARQNGISEQRIILDPGIGFGKTYEENCALIKNGGNFFDGKYPVLMALSRKRCIGTMTKNRPVEERLAGTLAANLISVQKGAKIVRVHDVKEMVDALNVLQVVG